MKIDWKEFQKQLNMLNKQFELRDSQITVNTRYINDIKRDLSKKQLESDYLIEQLKYKVD